MSSVSEWTDQLVELQLWVHLSYSALAAGDHAAVTRCTGQALQFTCPDDPKHQSVARCIIIISSRLRLSGGAMMIHVRWFIGCVYCHIIVIRQKLQVWFLEICHKCLASLQNFTVNFARSGSKFRVETAV